MERWDEEGDTRTRGFSGKNWGKTGKWGMNNGEGWMKNEMRKSEKAAELKVNVKPLQGLKGF